MYLLAAEKLGVAPEDCAVFEDVLAGVEGAKAVGMRAYCVRDSHSEKDFDAIARLADGMIDSFDEMRAHHAFAPSPRCVIFTARCEGDPRAAYAPRAGRPDSLRGRRMDAGARAGRAAGTGDRRF